MSDERPFDYSSEMREYYRSDDTAEEYHEAFGPGGDWRHGLIANRERAAIASLLREVPHETALDIPTGTGKLAPVFAETGSSVMACDVSESMLAIAEGEYARAGVDDARFRVCDAEEVADVIDESFHVAVCLRLLHRVPTDVKRHILDHLGDVADYVIASTGVETTFHEYRRRVRRAVFGGDERDHCYESPELTHEIFSDGQMIVEERSVLPVLSQEKVYLLRPEP